MIVSTRVSDRATATSSRPAISAELSAQDSGTPRYRQRRSPPAALSIAAHGPAGCVAIATTGKPGIEVEYDRTPGSSALGNFTEVVQHGCIREAGERGGPDELPGRLGASVVAGVPVRIERGDRVVITGASGF